MHANYADLLVTADKLVIVAYRSIFYSVHLLHANGINLAFYSIEVSQWISQWEITCMLRSSCIIYLVFLRIILIESIPTYPFRLFTEQGKMGRNTRQSL